MLNQRYNLPNYNLELARPKGFIGGMDVIKMPFTSVLKSDTRLQAGDVISFRNFGLIRTGERLLLPSGATATVTRVSKLWCGGIDVEVGGEVKAVYPDDIDGAKVLEG